MSEEEVIEEIKSLSPSAEACDKILDLYNKEKEKNKKLQQIIIINEELYNRETKRLGNIIGELLEE